MKKAIVLVLLATSLVGCGTPEFNQEAYDTALANKCHAGRGAPVKPWEYYKQTEDWKDAHAYYDYYIDCSIDNDDRFHGQKEG